VLVLIGLATALLLPLATQAQETPPQPPTVDEGAQAWLAQAAPDTTATFLVTLRDTDVQAQADQADGIADMATRRQRVHTLLTEQAQQNGDTLRERVRALGNAGNVQAFTPFVSANGFSITANKRVIEALQRWDRVSGIALDTPMQLELPQPDEDVITADAVEWNITQIGADRVQAELGITGRDIVVGGLDTGVRASHEALSGNYRCAGASDQRACWFDAVLGQAAPYDDNNHGTHTMGSAVGGNGIGVAPGATWIACKALQRNRSGTGTDILECMDWFLAPGGNAANAPDVVINSWGNNNGATTLFQQAVQNWINAGIVPVFSNGNSGPSCRTVGAPGSYPNVIGVGATDNGDVIASFSSRGPSPFSSAIKPDLSAPGVRIRSAIGTGDNAYSAFSGTSMAAPHVAGLTALMLDANPDLSIDQVTTTMKQTALKIAANDCGGNAEANNTYGWGRIQAFESVQAVLGSATPVPTNTITPTAQVPTATSTAQVPTATPAPGAGPQITSILGVQEGQALKGTVAIEVKLGSRDIAQVVFKLDGPKGTTWTEKNTPYFFMGNYPDGKPNGWNTSQHLDGNYALTVTATNKAGQSSAKTVNFRIANGTTTVPTATTAPTKTAAPTVAPTKTVAPTTAPTKTAAPATSTPAQPGQGSFAEQVVQLTNKERAAAGCPALAINAQLTQAGQGHSEDMAKNNYFSHTSQDGRSPWDRIEATGYNFRLAAENIAMGYGTPADVVKGWMNSSGHRRNILNCSLTEIGVGYATHANSGNRPYWTQVFATPR
jgi:uncharacterized protein YkwD